MMSLQIAQDTVQAAAPKEYYATDYRPWEDRYLKHVCEATFGKGGVKALDIGPGYGTMSVWLTNRRWRVTVMDVCEIGTFMTSEFCDELGVRYKQHNIERSSLDEVFDLIVMTQVLTHLKWRPDRALNNLREMLAPCGHAIISVTNRDDFQYNLDKVHHTRWQDVPEYGSLDAPLPYVTVCVYDRAEFEDLLGEVFGDSFEIEQSDDCVSMIATVWR